MSHKGSGSARVGAKRHHRVRETTEDLLEKAANEPSLRRLARRAGIKRIGGESFMKTQHALSHFLDSVLKQSVVYCEHARRKTITALDVVYSLKRSGRSLYGFGI